MRQVDRFGLAHMAPVQFADLRNSEQSEAFDDLLLQKLEHANDPLAAGGDQAVAVDSADPDAVGAQSECLHDIRAATYAAAAPDRVAFGDRRRPFGEAI